MSAWSIMSSSVKIRPDSKILIFAGFLLVIGLLTPARSSYAIVDPCGNYPVKKSSENFYVGSAQWAKSVVVGGVGYSKPGCYRTIKGDYGVSLKYLGKSSCTPKKLPNNTSSYSCEGNYSQGYSASKQCERKGLKWTGKKCVCPHSFVYKGGKCEDSNDKVTIPKTLATFLLEHSSNYLKGYPYSSPIARNYSEDTRKYEEQQFCKQPGSYYISKSVGAPKDGCYTIYEAKGKYYYSKKTYSPAKFQYKLLNIPKGCGKIKYHFNQAITYSCSNKALDEGGGGGSSSGGTSKAKASCAAAHKVWSNGKCTNVCKGGYAHTKNKPNACVIVAKTDDKTAPTVEIVAPSEGTTIKEHAEIKATAKDNVAVSSVEFYRSGPSGSSQTGSAIPQKLATDTSEPYSVQWNTTKLQNGTYSLTAVAFDSNGNKTTSDPVSVIIDNNSQAANHSHIAVTLEDESTVDVDLTGNCYKELKGNRMPIPQKFADEDVVASLSFTATCVTPGDSTEVGLTLADIYEEGDLKVYTQTGATITDITDKVVFTRDNNEETTTVTYSITDGGNGDNDAKKDGKVLGAVILVASDGSSGTGSGTGSGTTSSSSQSGSQTTTNADGTKVTTDANGNTYAAGKGASSLPNTGTSSVVGIMAIVGGLAAAVVYAIARKRGLHKPNL